MVETWGRARVDSQPAGQFRENLDAHRWPNDEPVDLRLSSLAESKKPRYSLGIDSKHVIHDSTLQVMRIRGKTASKPVCGGCGRVLG